jgi:hypothetical protein
MIGSRQRSQPAPPWAIFDDLCDPRRQPRRPWLHLLDDEIPPVVLESERPGHVVWSSLWAKRPDARLHFDEIHLRLGQVAVRGCRIAAESSP